MQHRDVVGLFLHICSLEYMILNSEAGCLFSITVCSNCDRKELFV